MLHKLEVKQLPSTMLAFPEPRYKRIADNETMLNFFMRLKLLEELIPLHSKARVIRAHREGSIESNLMKGAKKFNNFFTSVSDIREYYGDETAIYFEWMNYFQRWLLLPAVFAILSYVGNFFYDDISRNPLAGLFSAFMAVWGTIYITCWRRRTHELNTLWDDYTV